MYKKHIKFINENYKTLLKTIRRPCINEVYWVHGSESSIWLRFHFPQTGLYIKCNPFKIPAAFFIEFYMPILKFIQNAKDIERPK